MVKIGVLTSSRADFGVYLPLLKVLKNDSDFDLSVIAFGTHLSEFHGYTLKEIEDSNIDVKYTIDTAMSSASPEAISTTAGLCALKFSSFWATHVNEFDFVICLGDRYEMFSAVSAGIPFNIRFVHFYGGDTSLGAIDNVYRDCLSHSSIIHFTSTRRCAERVRNLKPLDLIDVVGILSLADLDKLDLLSINEFENKWDINLSIPTILITFHPETIEHHLNDQYAEIILNACEILVKTFQIVITMPNADTNGYIYREKFLKLKSLYFEKIYLIENFGRTSYFTCMKYCSLLLGNTSSGISEAASFKKYVVNVGDRQKGREVSANVISVEFDVDQIIEAVSENASLTYEGENIYVKDNAIENIISILKKDLK